MRTLEELQETIHKEKRIVLLVNKHSRQSEDLIQKARRLLQEKGFSIQATYTIENPKLLGMTIRHLLEDKPSLVIVGSGDGTVSELTQYFVHTDIVLGLLPLGTTNNFARSLDIPLTIEEAVDTIAWGVIKEIDLGTLNGRYFANVASVGISVDIAASVPHALKKFFGRFAYTLTGIPSFLGHIPFSALVVANGATHEFQTHQLIIANGTHHSGTLIASDASINNSLLALMATKSPSRWVYVKDLLYFLLKRKGTQKQEDILTSTEFIIQTNPPREVEIDGEVKMMTPIKAQVAPRALKVLVPKAKSNT